MMRSKLLLTSILLVAASMLLFAQDNGDNKMQTLFGDGLVTYGGYGGPRIAYSQFNGQDVWLVGGRGGVIFNHTFVIGGAGYGIVNSPKFANIEGNEVVYLEGGYGGMLMEYILKPNKIVHISIPLVVGAGGLLYSETAAANSGHAYEEGIIANTTFFVVEPGVELELNLVRFMRVSAGVSYRFAPGVNLPATPSNSFNAIVGSVSCKFGNF